MTAATSGQQRSWSFRAGRFWSGYWALPKDMPPIVRACQLGFRVGIVLAGVSFLVVLIRGWK